MSPGDSRNSVRSWPTQKPRPAPVMTTARASSSATGAAAYLPVGSVATVAELKLISSVEEEPLDAYSRVVTEVAALLTPSVANLRLRSGGGSGVVISPDGFVLTSAHVVARTRRGVASFVDGRELRFDVVGADPLSDLAVLRADNGDLVSAE